MIEQINHIAALWFSGAIAMFWQVGVLIILIGCVDLIIRKWAWPQLRYALWLMVLVKLVLPPTISLSTSVTSGLEPLARQIAAKETQRENLNATTATILANLETAAAETPVEFVSPRDIVTEQQPAIVFSGSEIVADESSNTAYIKLTWQAYAMAIWLAGMFVLGGWLIIKLLHLRKEDYRLAKTASLPESFYDAMTRCAKSLRLRRVPKVVLTRRVACPAVFGIIRPVLLMPVGYLSKMTRRDTENMLLHELAHIKRGDLWVHGFYMLLQVVYWYNPLLWLVRSQMHHLRELCCDATVARLLKERISEYRQTLIDVARRFLTKPTEPGLGLLGLFEDSNRLLVRLNWLKKETWRYQKMKKLTIITTIVLMLAFVLPMAQAQDKPATESSSADSTKAEEKPSQNVEATKVEQEQFQNQQELSQTMQKLQKQLQQLEDEKQKLQHELHALEHSKHTQQHAEHTEQQAAQAKIKAKEAKDKAEKVKDKAAKVKASAETHAKHMEQWAKQMEAWAEQYEAKMNSPEVQEKYKRLAENWAQKWTNRDEFKQWQKDLQQWAQNLAKFQTSVLSSSGDPAPEPGPMPVMPPMPPMPAEIAAPNVAIPAPPAPPAVVAPVRPQTRNVIKLPSERSGVALITGEFIDSDLAAEVLPYISECTGITIIPDETVKALVTCELKDVPLDRALEIVLAGTPYTYKKTNYYYLVCPGNIKTTKFPVLPEVKIEHDTHDKHVVVHDDKDGKYVATKEMHFVSKVKPGIPFVIRNSLGNIILKPSKDGNCDVRAVIRAKAKTEADAQAMVEQVSMNVQSSDEKYYLKPVKPDDDQWKDLNVDLYITVPPGIQPDVQTNMGKIEIYNFQGNIKAVTNMGAIKAVNTTGDVELLTKMGAIEFIAPKNLSAKFNILNKMGSIESELPLEVKKIDMFKTSAEGTIGAGRDNITMATNMGKISLKWQSSSQVEVKF